MKLISPFVLAVMAFAMSASAQAQTTDPIQKALLAAPNAAMARDATVIKWKPDFTYEVLKKGTSPMVCYDLTGWPGERPFSVECTSSEANLPRVAQNRKLAALGLRGRATGQRLTRRLRPPGKTERASCPKSGPYGISSGATARRLPSGTRLSPCRTSGGKMSHCRRSVTQTAPG